MRYIRNGIIRALIPFVIMSGIALSLLNDDTNSNGARSTFVVGLIIASVAGFSVIYDVEKWTLPKQSIVHFACMVATVLPCLLVSGWFETGSITDISRIFLVFLLCGLGLWGVSYIVFGRLLTR